MADIGWGALGLPLRIIRSLLSAPSISVKFEHDEFEGRKALKCVITNERSHGVARLLRIERRAADDVSATWRILSHPDAHSMYSDIKPHILTENGERQQLIRLGAGRSGEFFVVVHNSDGNESEIVLEDWCIEYLESGEYVCRVTVDTGNKKFKGNTRFSVQGATGRPNFYNDPRSS